MAKAPELIGARFGRLCVVQRAGQVPVRKALWKCLCDCGNTTFSTTDRLRSGHTRSCGCYRREVVIEQETTHGEGKTPWTSEYRAWNGMKQRCLNKRNERYPDWGGRGIKICSRWLSYPSFLADMGRKPGAKYSLDRIDNDGDYSPSNCRWATAPQQSRNRRCCKEVH